jgi:hypothetical protein
LGDKDIYKVLISESNIHHISSVISGSVTTASGPKPELRQVTLMNTDKKVLSVYKPYFISSHYVLSAQPGNYILRVEGYGFQPIEEEITIADTTTDIVKDFPVTVSK